MKKKKILIIDDDEIVRASCMKVLSSENFDVYTESDSASGIKDKPQITREEIVDELKPFLSSRTFVKAFERLRKARNDMNHAGYTQGYKKAKAFQKVFDQLLEEFDKELKFFNR